MQENMDFKRKLSERWKQISEEMFTVSDTPEDWVSLTDPQVGLLERNGNSSEEWSGVRVFRNAELDSVLNCVFRGEIRIAMTPAEIEVVEEIHLTRFSHFAHVPDRIHPVCQGQIGR